MPATTTQQRLAEARALQRAPLAYCDETGALRFRPAPVVPAFAEHGHGAIGGALPLRDLTRVTIGATLADGGEFVATLAGHLDDGAEVTIHGRPYRLSLAGAARVRRAA